MNKYNSHHALIYVNLKQVKHTNVVINDQCKIILHITVEWYFCDKATNERKFFLSLSITYTFKNKK